MSDLEARKKILEERQKKLHERKQLLNERRRIEDEELKTEEGLEIDSRWREIEIKKIKLEERKRKLEELREKQDEEVKKQEAEEYDRARQELRDRRANLAKRRDDLQMERDVEKDRNFEENRREIDERRKQMMDRRKELQDRRAKEDEEARKAMEEEVARNKAEIEGKRKRLEEKRRQIEAQRQLEDQKTKELEAQVATQSAIDEQKLVEELDKSKEDIASRRDALLARRQKLDAERQRQDEEETNAIKKQKEILAARREALNMQRSLLETTTQQEIANARAEIENRKQQLLKKREMLGSTQQAEVQADLSKQKEELQKRRADFEDRKRRIIEAKDKAQQDEEVRAARDQADIERSRAELAIKKARLAERSRMLMEIHQAEKQKEEDEQRAAEQLQREKEDLEKRKFEFQRRKEALLQEQKEKAERETREVEEMEKARNDLEKRKLELAQKRQALDDAKKEQEAKKLEEEIANRRREVEVRKLALEQRKKMMQEDAEKQEDEQKMKEEMENQRAKIEENRRNIEQRKMALQALRATEEQQMQVIEDQQMELEDKEEINDLKTKQFQLAERKERLRQRKEQLQEQLQRKNVEESQAQEDENSRKFEEDQLSQLEDAKRNLSLRKSQLRERREKLAQQKAASPKLPTESPTVPMLLTPPLPNSAEQDLESEYEAKKAEIMNRKRSIADRREAILTKLDSVKEAQQELSEIQEKEGELQDREGEVTARLKSLEEKQEAMAARTERQLTTLSSKEQEYLNFLTPEQREALTKTMTPAMPSKKEKGGLWKLLSRSKVKSEKTSSTLDAMEVDDDEDDDMGISKQEDEGEWREAFKDGEKYYYHSVTRETRWTLPSDPSPIPSTPSPAAPEQNFDLSLLSARERDIFLLLSPDEKRKAYQGIKEVKAISYDKDAFANQQRIKAQQKKDEEKRLKEEAKLKKKQDKSKPNKDEVKEDSVKDKEKKDKKKQQKVQYVPPSELSATEREFLGKMTGDVLKQWLPQDKLNLVTSDASATSDASISQDQVVTRGRRESIAQLTRPVLETPTMVPSPMPVPSLIVPSSMPTISQKSNQSFFYDESYQGTIKGASKIIITSDVPLHDAVKDGDISKLKGILEQVEPEVLFHKDKQGQTALHMACVLGELDCVITLINDCPSLDKNRMVEYLNSKDQNGRSPLVCAAYISSTKAEKLSHLQVCEFLLQQQGVDAKSETNDLNTALHYLVRASLESKTEDYRKLHGKVLEMLVEKGGDINAQSFKGETPLHQAALRGAKSSFEFLMNVRVKLKFQVENQVEKPPVALQKSPSNTMPKALGDLFKQGNPMSKSIDKTVDKPIDKPVDKSNAQSNYGQDYRMAINLKTTTGETALHYASKSGNIDFVKMLVQRWAVVDVVSEQGTAREIATSFNQLAIANYLDQIEKSEKAYLKLPPNEWLHVFSFLKPKDILKVSTVCKFFRRWTESDLLWQKKCQEDHVYHRNVKHSFKLLWKLNFMEIQNWKTEKQGNLSEAEKRILTRISAIAKGCVSRIRYRKMKKMRDQRNLLVQELIKTEQTYIDNLNIIVKTFATPLRAAVKENAVPGVNTSKITVLFGEVQMILKANTDFLEKLRFKLRNWNNTTSLSDVFLTSMNTFKVYAPYVNSFDKSRMMYEELKKIPAFQNWIAPFETKLSLPSLLIMPIQRLPRYNLLLRDIIKNTWVEHHDYKGLNEALQKMEKLTLDVNIQKGAAENKERLINIERSLDGGPEISKNPHRKFISECEVVEIVNSKNKIPLYIFLFTDIIIFTRPQKKRTIPPRFRFLQKENLYSIDVSDVEDGAFPNMLEITTTSKVIIVSAMHPSIRESFYSSTKMAINKAVRARQTGNLAGISDISENPDDDTVPANLPAEIRARRLEELLQKANLKLSEERRLKEQLSTSKLNLENQVKNLMSMFEAESKKRSGSVEGSRLIGSPSMGTVATAPMDPLDAMALAGLSDKEKGMLAAILPNEKREKIQFLNKILQDPKKLKKQQELLEKREKKAQKDTLKKGGKTSIREGRSSTRETLREPTVFDFAQKGSFETVGNMLNAGQVSINQTNDAGQTLLHIACNQGFLELVVILLKGSNQKEKINLNVKDDIGDTPLLLASNRSADSKAKLDHLRIVEMLLQEKSVDVSHVTLDLNTPLHLMARANFTLAKDKAMREAVNNCIQLFVKKGIDVDQINGRGETALHIACSEGNADVVHQLLGVTDKKSKRKSRSLTLKKGSVNSLSAFSPDFDLDERPADVNIGTDLGDTPLHLAAKNGSLEIVQLLVKRWAEISVKNHDRLTPSQIAQSQGHVKIVDYLHQISEAEKIKTLQVSRLSEVLTVLRCDLKIASLVCHAWKRASAKARSDAKAFHRITHRADLKRSVTLAASRSSSFSDDMASPDHSRAAFVHLAEETERRKKAEKALIDMKDELEKVKDPHRYTKLEQLLKMERINSDNMQQQWVFQLERNTDLEKKVKELQNDKIEAINKYDERVYFIEKKSQEKIDEIMKETANLQKEMRTKDKAFDQNMTHLKDQLLNLHKRLVVYLPPGEAPTLDLKEGPIVSTGPAIPVTRPMSAVSSGNPTAPTAPNTGTLRKPPPRPQDLFMGVPAPVVPSTVKVPSVQEFKYMRYDMWESPNKLLVALDFPGIHADLVDIHISRFGLMIAFKMGIFEERHVAAKYRNLVSQRYDVTRSGQVEKIQLVLPFAVHPTKKTAHLHCGTFYISLERLIEQYGSVSNSDWSEDPHF